MKINKQRNQLKKLEARTLSYVKQIRLVVELEINSNPKFAIKLCISLNAKLTFEFFLNF